MKLSSCRVTIDYEGIQKQIAVDLLIKGNQEAMLVFRWYPRNWFGRAVRVGKPVALHQLSPTGLRHPQYQQNTPIDVDSAEAPIRAYLLKTHFGS
jgi:hypothetical protein